MVPTKPTQSAPSGRRRRPGQDPLDFTGGGSDLVLDGAGSDVCCGAELLEELAGADVGAALLDVLVDVGAGRVVELVAFRVADVGLAVRAVVAVRRGLSFLTVRCVVLVVVALVDVSWDDVAPVEA